jgi:hypothetical protein
MLATPAVFRPLFSTAGAANMPEDGGAIEHEAEVDAGAASSSNN